MPTLKEWLSIAPDSQLDASMVELVKAWHEPPLAIQVLEVLDWCIFSSLASEVVVAVMQYELEAAITREGTTRESVVARAVWRPEGDRV